MNKAIFLDRDGVLNKQPKIHDYVKNYSEFKWLPDAKEAIELINKNGYLAIVITNQRGVARDLMMKDDVDKIHKKMIENLKLLGAKINGVYWCEHDYSDNCDCRKPKPGLIFKAAKDFDIDLASSWVVGDSDDDIKAGYDAGCQTFKIKTDGSLLKAISQILQ